MAGLFVWMKRGRVFVPGEASSQAAGSVDPGGEEVDEAIPEVHLRLCLPYCNFTRFSFVAVHPKDMVGRGAMETGVMARGATAATTGASAAAVATEAEDTRLVATETTGKNSH